MLIEESLVYFTRYNSLVQLSVEIDSICVYVNYHVNIFIAILRRKRGGRDIAKKLVKHLEDDFVIENHHIRRYGYDSGWLELLLPRCDIYQNYLVLTLFCKCGNLGMVKYLLNHVVECHRERFDTFESACEYGHLHIVEYLFDQLSDDWKVKYIQSAYQSLMLAARKGHIDIVKWLVSKGVDIRADKYDVIWSSYIADKVNVTTYLLDQLNEDEKRRLTDVLLEI